LGIHRDPCGGGKIWGSRKGRATGGAGGVGGWDFRDRSGGDVVGDPDIVLGIHRDPCGGGKIWGSRKGRARRGAGGVGGWDFRDRIAAAVSDPDVMIGIHRDPGGSKSQGNKRAIGRGGTGSCPGRDLHKTVGG